MPLFMPNQNNANCKIGAQKSKDAPSAQKSVAEFLKLTRIFTIALAATKDNT